MTDGRRFCCCLVTVEAEFLPEQAPLKKAVMCASNFNTNLNIKRLILLVNLVIFTAVFHLAVLAFTTGHCYNSV